MEATTQIEIQHLREQLTLEIARRQVLEQELAKAKQALAQMRTEAAALKGEILGSDEVAS